MSRPLVIGLFALLVVIWSSTWVAIKLGLEDTPPLYGAGIRFALAGLLLLVIAAARRRSLRTDVRLAAILAILPFALSYGLIYWAEQHIPSGLTAVLFAVMPLYSAALAVVWLREEPVSVRFLGGVVVALGGLVLAFGESIELGGGGRLAALGALAAVSAPLASAIGNTAIKRRARELDAVVLNGWAMLGGGVLLLALSAPLENWGAAVWTGQAVAALAFLTVLGSAVPFVVLTVLIREVGAIRMSILPLLLPFGALGLGALLADERVTVTALLGALLVVAGLVVGGAAGRRAGTPGAQSSASASRRASRATSTPGSSPASPSSPK